jgi:hypothetical protein
MLASTFEKACLLTALLIVGVGAALADAFTPSLIANVQAEGKSLFMTGVRGSCGDKSHTAVGAVGGDLTKQQTPFVCDAAIIAEFDPQHVHIMITFAEKASTKSTISFAGMMNVKENVIQVSKVYFEPGKPTYIDVGVCKMFFTGRHMSGIFCGGKIDADGQRTVANISFDAEPGQ